MKVHQHLVVSAAHILKDIFVGGSHADKALEFNFKKNKRWGARDRKFVAEAVYDVVRWYRRLKYAAEIPDDLILVDIKDFKKLVEVWIEIKYLPNIAESSKYLTRYQSPDREALTHSLPDWLFERVAMEVGNNWADMLNALNQEAPVVLRVNRLKTEMHSFCVNLVDLPHHFNQRFQDAVVLDRRANVFRLECFKLGHFELQDLASQMVSIFLDPKPGEKVVDACAGAGGKSLHMAALMKNRGKIVALDVSQGKLDQLRKRCSRAGVDIIESRLIDTKTTKRLTHSADKLLLDVPCSGSGVWRRNPDSKWKLTPDSLDQVIALQREILNTYKRIVKPKGELIYSTCSLFRSENSDQIKAFLSENPDFSLVEELHLSPLVDGTDGFYMAKLKNDVV